MSFSIEIPSKEEIKAVIKLAKEFPEFLDSKEIWILENYVGGFKCDHWH